MNCLTKALSDVCGRHFLDEKWLVAPSLRIGHQWLEAVARAGQACVNVRVKTLRTLALELAEPPMSAGGLTLLPDRGAAILIDRAWNRLSKSEPGYLSALEPSIALAERFYGSLTALGLADLHEGDLTEEAFEDGGKGRELAGLWKHFRADARSRRRLAYAEVVRLAMDRLREGTPLPTDVLVLVPADIDASALERAMLAALPMEQRLDIPVDASANLVADRRPTDAELLRWILSPTEAPAPAGDGTARIGRAVGEVNEVREVLRRCLAEGWALDQVELLYTDADTYGPLVYEQFLRLATEDRLAVGDVSVTFADGIPARYARPGRLLALWVAWVRDGLPQRTLGRMLQEALLRIPEDGEAAPSPGRLATLLGGLGIGYGRERYLPALNEQVAALEEPAPAADDAEDPELAAERAAGRAARLAHLYALRDLVRRLLDMTPEPGNSPAVLLRSAVGLLTEFAAGQSKLDNTAREKLLAEIDDMAYWLGEEEGDVSLDVWDWLGALPAQTRVLAANPAPGCLHAAPLSAGGHSGRPHTFIVGLDDGRFPGPGYPDPVLLDGERRRLSRELRTSAQEARDKLDAFARLLARLRGTVSLSFSCHDLVNDAEMFPSGIVLSTYRILSGEREADQSAMLKALPPAASFTPASAEGCLGDGEWWLWCHDDRNPVRDAEGLVAARYPHLARGWQAAACRAQSEFTAFDGFVPEAGRDQDPLAADGPVMTAGRLEAVGRCPMRYFLAHVLRVQPPEEVGVDRGQWLDALASGSLLHETFERFTSLLQADRRPPDFDRDWPRLREVLAERVEEYKRRYPVPGAGVFRHETRRLEETARIFLREEEAFSREHGSRPVYLEACLGLPSRGAGTPLDCGEPIALRAADGMTFRASGRVDRVDLVEDGPEPLYAVWDYKTGRPRLKKASDFTQGRAVQSTLYLQLVAERLRQLNPRARVAYFGYFFPGLTGRGERIVWTPEEVGEGLAVLSRLLRVVRAGAFLPTDDHEEDCKYCKHRAACGNVEAVTRASGVKIDTAENSALEPLRELRRDAEDV